MQLADTGNPDAPEPAGLLGAVRKLFGRTPEEGEPDPEAPVDPYKDHDALIKLLEEFHSECFNGREEFERLWWRNIVYSAFGRHWIYYDRDSRTWRDKRLAKWIPKPVTNITGETAETIVSTFQAVQLGVVARPVGNDPNNARTAELADRYHPVLDGVHNMKERMRLADWWAVHLGGVFLHVWWDPNAEKSMRLIPFERCAHCGEVVRPDELEDNEGVCYECNESTLFEPAMDEQQLPIGETVPDGEGRTDVVSMLELGFPLSAENFDEVPGVIRLRWKPKSWFQRFRKDLVKDMNWEKMTPERSLQMLRSISTQTSVGSQPWSGAGAQPMESEGVTEAELWWKPSKDYPEGLVCRFVNNGGTWQVIEYEDENLPGPIPHEDALGNKLWPWVFYPYKVVGGRLVPESPLNPIIQKNDQLNQIDALVQLCLQRTANPVWLEPKGAEVTKFTGEPGLVVQWNPLVGGGNAKPERLEGSSVPAYVLEYRGQIVSDIERLAGTYDILKGEKPAGVEAFAAMQLLVERSQSRFGPVLEQRGEAYRRWYALALELERKYGPEERMVSVLGANDAWAIDTFKNEDLQGNVTILVEDGSQVPKTNLGERAAIEHLNQLGLIDKMNPDTQYAILKSFGQTKLMPQLDVQVRACRAMQDEFERWAETAELLPPPPTAVFEPDPADPTGATPLMDPATQQVDPETQQPVPGTGNPMPPQPQWSAPPPGVPAMRWNDPLVWSAEIRKWLCGDRMRNLLREKPDLVPVADQLLGQYEMVLQAQMAAQQGLPPGGGDDQQGAGRAMRNSNQNAGSGSVPNAA
jgi:hypothetical protein